MPDGATEPPAVDGGTAKVNAKLLDPHDEVSAILKTDEADGVFTLRYYRDSFHRWHGGRYEEIPVSDIRAIFSALLLVFGLFVIAEGRPSLRSRAD